MGKLNKLIEHRDAILLAEIGALIHDLGKLSEEFITQMSKDEYLQFDHEKILEGEYKESIWFNSSIFDIMKDKNSGIVKNMNALYDYLRNNISGFRRNLQKMENFGGFISNHHGKDKNLFYPHFFKFAADVIDSGVDKGAAINTNKQFFTKTFISSPFGYEFERVEVEKESLKKYRNKFVKVLEQVLTEINNILSKSEKIPVEKWVELRKKIIEKARDCFIHALGETRRSANDVTLWDHSYSTASLYKTALAEIILSGKWKNPSEFKWRLLLIRFNGLDYIFKGVKIGDIKARKEKLNEALDRVRNLLEVIVPIGNEIYRDENGSVFVIPESFSSNMLNNEEIEINDEKSNLKNKILEIFRSLTNGELCPKINISEERSRGVVILGRCLEKYVHLYNLPYIDYIESCWNGVKDKVVCIICGLKPADRNERVCEDCKELREKRVEKWLRNKSETIWIDEVCDENGRVGIIVGAFDLKWWLNGMWLNTCFTKTLDCLKKEKPEIFAYINSYEDLVRAIEEAIDINNPNQPLKSFKKNDGSNILVKELLKSMGGESYHNQSAKEYFEAIVLNREKDVISWAYGLDPNNLSNREKAELLALALMRKNPSFARIRRIWETCSRFWKEIENEITKVLKPRDRYKIILDENSYKILMDLIKSKKLKEKIAYEIRCNGFRVPMVIINKEIIVIEALDTLKIKEKFENSIKSGFEIWEPSDYGYHSEKIYPQTDKDSKLVGKCLEKDSKYIPYIPIVTDIPTIFICLIPLKDSWEILKRIKTLYEIEFSKVQNRLPIKLGLIAFKRKFPLYIALESAKRFLNENIREYCWIVENTYRLSSEENCKRYSGKLGNYGQKIKIKSQTSYRSATLYISYSLGDPDLRDVFYPYYIVKDQCIIPLYKDFCNELKELKENINLGIKHVENLKENDKIIFLPSIFDFEFLDSNIRRFDIGIKRKHWIFTESENKPKPYLLWDIDNFERLRELIKKLELTNTQMMNLYEMLMAKLEEWEIRKLPIELLNSSNEEEQVKGDIFKKFIENAIKDIPLRLEIVDGESSKGKISKEDFEFLKNSIMSGLFFDFVDLWHTILKKEFGGDENV